MFEALKARYQRNEKIAQQKLGMSSSKVGLLAGLGVFVFITMVVPLSKYAADEVSDYFNGPSVRDTETETTKSEFDGATTSRYHDYVNYLPYGDIEQLYDHGNVEPLACDNPEVIHYIPELFHPGIHTYFLQVFPGVDARNAIRNGTGILEPLLPYDRMEQEPFSSNCATQVTYHVGNTFAQLQFYYTIRYSVSQNQMLVTPIALIKL